MNNLNLMAIEGNTVRFYGFDHLEGAFTYRFTAFGLVLRPREGAEGHLADGEATLRDGRCTDVAFVAALKERSFTYNIFLWQDTAYIGTMAYSGPESLDELVEEVMGGEGR